MIARCCSRPHTDITQSFYLAENNIQLWENYIWKFDSVIRFSCDPDSSEVFFPSIKTGLWMRNHPLELQTIVWTLIFERIWRRTISETMCTTSCVPTFSDNTLILFKCVDPHFLQSSSILDAITEIFPHFCLICIPSQFSGSSEFSLSDRFSPQLFFYFFFQGVSRVCSYSQCYFLAAHHLCWESILHFWEYCDEKHPNNLPNNLPRVDFICVGAVSVSHCLCRAARSASYYPSQWLTRGCNAPQSCTLKCCPWWGVIFLWDRKHRIYLLNGFDRLMTALRLHLCCKAGGSFQSWKSAFTDD